MYICFDYIPLLGLISAEKAAKIQANSFVS